MTLDRYCPAGGVSLSGPHQKPRLCRVVVGISFVFFPRLLLLLLLRVVLLCCRGGLGRLGSWWLASGPGRRGLRGCRRVWGPRLVVGSGRRVVGLGWGRSRSSGSSPGWGPRLASPRGFPFLPRFFSRLLLALLCASSLARSLWCPLFCPLSFFFLLWPSASSSVLLLCSRRRVLPGSLFACLFVCGRFGLCSPPSCLFALAAVSWSPRRPLCTLASHLPWSSI